jgi:3-oxoacyl-[acyl-carrier protein] reductase
MKTVCITGANRGIGNATSKLFAERGWKVIAHARKQTSLFDTFCNEISAMPVFFDMLDVATMKNCIKSLKENGVIIDALVNCAGIAGGNLFQMTNISEIRHIFDVNLFAQMELTQLILKLMAKEGASIVNVASVAGIDLRASNSAYGVSKAAVIAWTKVLSLELMGKVRVNAVAPGLTQTDMALELEKKHKPITPGKAKFGRLGQPHEIAEAILYLSSDKASFVSGTVFRVDGGGGYLEKCVVIGN